MRNLEISHRTYQRLLINIDAHNTTNLFVALKKRLCLSEPSVHVMLIRDGFAVNRLRVLWPKGLKPSASRVPVVVRGLYLNHVWAIDFHFDETDDDQPVKILNVTDEFLSEDLATNSARRIPAARTIAVPEQI